MKLITLACAILITTTVLSPAMLNISAEEISLISMDIDKWTSLDAKSFNKVSKAMVTLSQDVLQFDNTNGLWPSMEYVLEHQQLFNINNHKIQYDFTPGKRTQIRIHFLDGDRNEQFVHIALGVNDAHIVEGTDEIGVSSSPLIGELSLKDLKTGKYSSKGYLGKTVEESADSDGNIFITRVCIVINGFSNNTIDLGKLAIVKEDTVISTQSVTNLSSIITKDKDIHPTSKKTTTHPIVIQPVTRPNTTQTSSTSKKIEGSTSNESSSYTSVRGSTTSAKSTTYETSTESVKQVTVAAKYKPPSSKLSGLSPTRIILLFCCIILIIAFLIFFKKPRI